MYQANDCFIIASAERLFRVEPSGSLKWSSKKIGIDGVVVDCVQDGIIHGQGEWDPPEGWKPFQIHLESSSLLKEEKK